MRAINGIEKISKFMNIQILNNVLNITLIIKLAYLKPSNFYYYDYK